MHELLSREKQYRGISRFCHQSEELIDPSNVVLHDANLEHDPELLRFISRQTDRCLILSPDGFLNGQEMDLETAVREAARSTDAVLILGNGYALVFGEAEKNGRDKYFLKA